MKNIWTEVIQELKAETENTQCSSLVCSTIKKNNKHVLEYSFIRCENISAYNQTPKNQLSKTFSIGKMTEAYVIQNCSVLTCAQSR